MAFSTTLRPLVLLLIIFCIVECNSKAYSSTYVEGSEIHKIQTKPFQAKGIGDDDTLSPALNLSAITVLTDTVLTSKSATSASNNDTAKKFIVIRDLEDSWSDAKELWSGLTTSSSSSLTNAGLYAGTMALGIVAGMQADEQLRSLVLRNQSNTGTKLFDIPNRYGELYSMAGIGGGLYLGGWIFGSNDTRKTGRLLFESLLLSGTITTGLKYVFGRARPFMNEGAFSYQPFGEWNDARFAFPSGHTTAAFAMSTVLAMRIKNVYASIGLYTLAVSTGVARMYYDKHWLTDTMFGGIIGTLSAIAVVNASDRVTKREEGCSCESVYSPMGIKEGVKELPLSENNDAGNCSHYHPTKTVQWVITPTMNGLSFSIIW